MGRRDETEEAGKVTRLHLQRVPINSQGYDPGGAYWGTGQPLYVAFDTEADTEYMQEIFFRAWTRNEAKEEAKRIFPNAKFYR